MTYVCHRLEKHVVVFSHGKNHKISTSPVLPKFSKLDRYHKSDVIRKSSIRKPADVLNDCTAQRLPGVQASDRADPSCKKKQEGTSRQEKKSASAQIFYRGLFVNNSMDQNMAS